MVCDKCNFFCCHTYCETPPLRQVPTEEWFCQTCREDTAESIFEESNDDSDTEIENKRYMTRGASSLLSSQQVSQTVSMSLRPRRNKNRNIFNNIDK